MAAEIYELLGVVNPKHYEILSNTEVDGIVFLELLANNA